MNSEGQLETFTDDEMKSFFLSGACFSGVKWSGDTFAYDPKYGGMVLVESWHDELSYDPPPPIPKGFRGTSRLRISLSNVSRG